MEDYKINPEGVSDSQGVTPGLAIGSLVCGILAFFIPFFGFILAILAIIFGVRVRGMIRESEGRLGGEGMALAGLICGIVAIATSLLWIFVILGFLRFLFSFPFMYRYWYY
jgi:hypothetical protein